MTFFFNKANDRQERSLATSGAFGTEAAALMMHPMSWSAIIAGTLTALVCQLVLNLLGLGIGLSTVDANGGGAGAKAFSIGAGIWIVITAIATYAIGGYVAGRLAGKPLRSTAGYHGLVTWALTTVVVIFLLTSAVGSIVGGTLSAVTGAFGGAGHAVSSAVQTVAPQVTAQVSAQMGGDPLTKITDQLKAKANQPDNAAAANDAVAAVKSALSSDPSQRQQANEQAAQAIAKLTNVSVDQARTQVQGYESQYDQLVATAKQKGAEAADAAASAASKGALAAAISLIVGALAAFFAGRFGAVRLQSLLAEQA